MKFSTKRAIESTWHSDESTRTEKSNESLGPGIRVGAFEQLGKMCRTLEEEV